VERDGPVEVEVVAVPGGGDRCGGRVCAVPAVERRECVGAAAAGRVPGQGAAVGAAEGELRGGVAADRVAALVDEPVVV